MSELVYCLPAAHFPAAQEQVIPITAAFYASLAQEGQFLARDAVEDDPSWRQLIPYAVVSYQERVLCVERLRAGGEARLHQRLSLGIGGHIGPQDKQHPNARDLIEAALARELREELHIGAFFAQLQGLLLSEQSAVERVHAGLLYHVRTAAEPSIRENHKLRGQLQPWEDVQTQQDRLEHWSALALQHHLQQRAATAQDYQ